MTEDQESRLEKIVKLLRKAESTTPAEAEALTEKAQQLMARWAIDEAMLQSAQGNAKQESIVEHEVDLKGVYKQAHLTLGNYVGRASGVRVWFTDKGNYLVLHFAGWESDVRRADMLFASLLIQAASAQKKFVVPSYLSAMGKFKERRDFLMGFATAVYARLEAANKYAKTEAKQEQADSGAGMELVLVDRKQRVDNWVDEKYGSFRSSRSRMSGGSGRGYGAGSVAGSTANVGNPGVSGGSKALTK